MKTQENSILDPFWKLFVNFMRKNNFWKIFHILLFLDFYYWAKVRKKLTISKKNWLQMYRWMEGWLHRLMDKHEFLISTLRGSNKMNCISWTTWWITINSNHSFTYPWKFITKNKFIRFFHDSHSKMKTGTLINI